MINTYEDIIGIKKCSYCGQLKANRKVVYRFPIAGDNAKEEVITCLTCTPKIPSYVQLSYPREDSNKIFVRRTSDDGGVKYYNIEFLEKNKIESICNPEGLTFINMEDDIISFYVPVSWVSFDTADDFLKSKTSVFYDREGLMNRVVFENDSQHDIAKMYDALGEEGNTFLIKNINNVLEIN